MPIFRIIRKRQLESAPKATVAVGAFVLDEGQNAQQSAKKYFSTPVVKKTEIGGVTIDERSAKDSLAHGYGQRKLDVLATLQNDFDNAVYLNSRRDFDDKDVMNHYFAYPVSYNGEINYVFCRARQDINMNRLYVHEVFSEDEIEKAVPFKPLPNVHLKGLKPHGGTALYKNILQQILNANPHGVMADIDENGEPKIVQEGQFHE